MGNFQNADLIPRLWGDCTLCFYEFIHTCFDFLPIGVRYCVAKILESVENRCYFIALNGITRPHSVKYFSFMGETELRRAFEQLFRSSNQRSEDNFKLSFDRCVIG